jgi:hypothetical protein
MADPRLPGWRRKPAHIYGGACKHRADARAADLTDDETAEKRSQASEGMRVAMSHHGPVDRHRRGDGPVAPVKPCVRRDGPTRSVSRFIDMTPANGIYCLP